jgi:hypothetical protein
MRNYKDFASRIDVDAFEEAIDFDPIKTDDSGNDIGHCPDIWGLHKNGDTTGKFAIHREKKVYNCWVCGGGSFLSFAMEFKQMGEEEATEWLYQFASEDAVSAQGFVEEIERMLVADAEASRHDALPYFNERVLDTLEPAYEWARLRSIKEEVVDHMGIRFDPARTRGSYEGPAIVFPHRWQGRLVGWQERWLEGKPQYIPKYTNTSDFPREITLYNYDWTMFDQEVVICESAPTVLALLSLGIPAMATFGSNVTSEQMKLMRRCIEGIVIAPDNDRPGIKFIESLHEGLDRYIPIKVIEPIGEEESGDDLADLGDPKLVLEAIQSAEYL